MITVSSKAGLHGFGDLGTVVPAPSMGRAPEDSFILGLGRRFQRDSVLLGAITRRTPPAAARPATAVRQTATAATLQRTGFISQRQPTLPTPKAPRPSTRVPTPGAGMQPPRPLSPSGATATWPQTTASPVPLQPPVQPPSYPPPPSYAASPFAYDAETPGSYAADPYAHPAVSQPAGAQTALVSTYADGSTPNADGTITTADGSKVDAATGAVIASAPSAAWQWAKDHKGAIGIGALVIAGVIVLAKVL